MSAKSPYKEFILQYLTRGTVGVSVGLAAVAPASAMVHEINRGEQTIARSFSARLSMVRDAVSECMNDSLRLAQLGPARPLFKNVRSFPNSRPFLKQPQFRSRV
jgi:hypothetical protein